MHMYNKDIHCTLKNTRFIFESIYNLNDPLENESCICEGNRA